MKTVFAALVLALGLLGCTTPQPEVRVVYKYIRVPVEMTEKVVPSPPPDPAVYSQMPWDKQEETLMSVIQERTKELGVCNARTLGIRAWSNKQALIYEPVFSLTPQQ